MIGYPLDSHVEFNDDGIPTYDRAITSAPLRMLFKKLFSDGVLPNPSTNMQVSAGDGMNVVVSPGFAMCNGCMKLEEAQRTLAVQASSAVYDRIDTVVLRLNDNDSERICDFYIVQGTPGTSPVRPTLTRTESIWEIGLADLFIAKNSTVISNQRITDTRYETSRCGIMSSISEFDTTTLYQQVQADLAGFKTEEQAEFMAWFEEMRGQLSEDAAGNLQNQIESINEVNNYQEDELSALKAKIGSTDISQIGDGTVTGAVTSCFQSVSDGKAAVATALTNKGIATASDADFSTMAANIGAIKTAKGTAGTAQVLTGYTFSNNNGGPLSGTMPNRGAWKGATSGNGNVTIPAGWHNGSGYVSGAGAYNAGYNAGQSAVSVTNKTFNGLNTNLPGNSVGYYTFNAGFPHRCTGLVGFSITNAKNGATYGADNFSLASVSISGNTVTIGIYTNGATSWTTSDNIRGNFTVSGY